MLTLLPDIPILFTAYLIGSLSGSLLLGRLRGVDIRTQGSGNAGSTNAFRTQGRKFALGVLLIDISKGITATWLALRFASPQSREWLAHAAAFVAIVGHVWPLWHGFRGGKGAATAMGGLLVLWPLIMPALLAVWLLSLILSGYVGLSTILAGLALAAAAGLNHYFDPANPALLVFAISAALLIIFTHRGNLTRLRAGTESRFEKMRLLHRISRRA